VLDVAQLLPHVHTKTLKEAENMAKNPKKTRRVKKNYEFPIAELAIAKKARHTFTLEELDIAVKKKMRLPK
jgi:hypothetical protein